MSAPLWSLSFEDLERREALYLRLLLTQTGALAESLYARLCDVRLEMFGRDR